MALEDINSKKTPIIVRPLKIEEREKVSNLIDISFSKDPENPKHCGFFNQFIYMPFDRNDFFWAVFVEDEPVAACMLVPFVINIEGVLFQVVGFTGIGTHPNHRHKGYASKLMGGIHNYLKSKNYDGGVLHSAADMLYYKMGYEFCFLAWLAEFDVSLDLINSLKKIIEPLLNTTNINNYTIKLIETCKNDKNSLDSAIDEQDYKYLFEIWKNCPQKIKRKVTLERTLYYFKNQLRNHLNSRRKLMLLLNENSIEAYCLFSSNDDEITITEIISKNSNKNDYAQIIHYIIQNSRDNECSSNKVIIKHYFEDTELKSLLKDLKAQIYSNLMTGNMAIWLNPLSVLKKLQPVFSKRIGDNYEIIPPEISCKYKLKIENQIIICEIGRGSVSIYEQNIHSDVNYPIIKMDSHEFIALSLGYFSIEEMDIEGFDKLDKKEQIIFNTLFPALNPVWDYFHSY